MAAIKVVNFPESILCQERIENRREIGTGGEDGLKKVFTGYFSALVAGGKTTGYLGEKGRLTK